MVLKFLYIMTDPFVNNTEEFVRILGVDYFATPTGSSLPSSNGKLLDPSGNIVSAFTITTDYQGNSATAYPYATAVGFQSSQIIIIPPGWSFSNFGRAIAVQGSLEEVLRVN
jgi:hypothetical protein